MNIILDQTDINLLAVGLRGMGCETPIIPGDETDVTVKARLDALCNAKLACFAGVNLDRGTLHYITLSLGAMACGVTIH